VNIFLVVHDILNDVPHYDAFQDIDHALECAHEILDGYERDGDPLVHDSHVQDLWMGEDGETAVQIVKVPLQ
jgi:hypothetical protein